MENYLISYNLNIENTDNKKISHLKKKKKFIACNYCWKEFYSDDEDNSYYNQNLTNNYNIARKKRKLSQISNSSNNKTKLKKSYTMNKIEKRYELENKNVDYSPFKYRRNTNKKVHFPSKNFVKYIYVESYKKYNSLSTDIDFSINERNNSFKENEIKDKADAKCTCLIF